LNTDEEKLIMSKFFITVLRKNNHPKLTIMQLNKLPFNKRLKDNYMKIEIT